ncbi:MAG: sulfite exporter TauE/SafE family protein [Hyphomicrobiaceae bacterium]
MTIALLFVGGLIAGTVNVMAGGAGFLTFPLLIAAGLSELEANAANFVAVVPANIVGTYVYRHDIAQVRRHLGIRLALAAAGGVIGALLLVGLGEASFHRAIPWLLAFATASFVAGPAIKRRLERDFAFDGERWIWLSLALEFIVYVYGGYFGLGMSIVLFAIHAMFSSLDIHQSNAIRNVTISLMALISIAIFARTGIIRWGPSLIMMAGAWVGGYAMVRIAKTLPHRTIRSGLIGWAIVMTAYAFWQYR